jgi:WD40 repeat protein
VDLLLVFSVVLFAQQDARCSETLTLIRKIQVDRQGTAGAVDGCAFSTKGDLVAASDNTGLTKIYRVADGEFVLQVKHNERKVSRSNGETNAIHFSVDDRYFLTGMNDTGCKIWELATGKMIKNLGHGKNTDGAAFSPDGKWVAVAHDHIAAVYRLWDFEKVAEIGHPKSECNSIDWSSDGSLLITGSDGACCKITRTADWQALHNIDFGKNRVKSVRISPDDQLVAVSGQAGRCRVYRVSNGKMVADLPHESHAQVLPGDDDDGDEPNVEAVEWSTEGRYLFTGGLYDGIIRIWRVADWSLIGSAQGQQYNRQVEYMAINPDNILAAGGDEGFLYLLKFEPPANNEAI